MSKSVLMSIQPKWCELIASGKKTVEVRKTKPKIKTPFKCYIYCTQGKSKDLRIIKESTYLNRQKVIGEFVCNNIEYISACFGYLDARCDTNNTLTNSCLLANDFYCYGKGKDLYGWHISELKIYDKPRELSEFKKYNRTEENICCAHLGLGIPDCKTCKECNLKRPPQSWCYVEE